MVTACINRAGRVEIRCQYDSSVIEFCQSLPGVKWSKERLCWECDFTPAAAFRIASHCPQPVEYDDCIAAAAADFRKPILHPLPADATPPVCKSKPWRHQAAAFWFAFPREASLLAMAMGTGKTKVAIDLAESWGINNALILCPLSVRGVWLREFARHGVSNWNVCAPNGGTASRRQREAENAFRLAEARGMKCAIVINYDTAKICEFREWSLSRAWDLAIADESHRAKSHSSQTSKYMAALAFRAKRRLALTGTPMSHSPMDLFGQMRFVDRGIFGTSYHRYRARYAVTGHFGANHIVGFKNQDELAARMALVTFMVDSSVLDLPDAQHITIPVRLSPESRKIYDDLEREMIAFLQGGGEITAANGLVRLLRCQQVVCGHVMADDENDVREIGTEKADVLRDLLEDLDEPVVVCCRFRHDLVQVERVAASLGRRYGEVSGRVKCLTAEAQMPEDVDVLGVQQQSGGVGVDLTRARIAVLWSTGFSLGDYEQFLARIHRPGQRRPVVYYHLAAESTVDERIHAALQEKREVVDEVMAYLGM